MFREQEASSAKTSGLRGEAQAQLGHRGSILIGLSASRGCGVRYDGLMRALYQTFLRKGAQTARDAVCAKSRQSLRTSSIKNIPLRTYGRAPGGRSMRGIRNFSACEPRAEPQLPVFQTAIGALALVQAWPDLRKNQTPVLTRLRRRLLDPSSDLFSRSFDAPGQNARTPDTKLNHPNRSPRRRHHRSPPPRTPSPRPRHPRPPPRRVARRHP